MSFYTSAQASMQDRFDSLPLAERLVQTIVSDEITEMFGPFIASRDFFFLATVDGDGRPTVSYKGGAPGMVTILDPTTLVFPNYDGNGMFLSMGNIADTAKIGMLFVDFETPNRVRVQATATVSDQDPEMTRYPGANLVVRAVVDKVFVNCGRYIHPHRRVESSKYVPDLNGEAPYPAWKRIDFVQDVLHPDDQGRAVDEGGIITFDDYAAKLAVGDS